MVSSDTTRAYKRKIGSIELHFVGLKDLVRSLLPGGRTPA